MEYRILITGANGLIGGKLIKKLLETTDFRVAAVAATEEKLQDALRREGIVDKTRVEFLSNEQFLSGSADLRGVFGAVHLAFSRRIRPTSEIAASINMSRKVFARLAEAGINRIINMSSQGVYGNVPDVRTEDTPPGPENPYSMAKYASEVVFTMCMSGSTVQNWTSLRLDPIVQSQNLVRTLCAHARDGKLELRGGKQRFTFIDASDSAEAVIAMLYSPGGWERVYNVGWNRRWYTLVEVAETVADAAEKVGIGRPMITLEEQDIMLYAGMDSSRFMKHTGWTPKKDLKEMAIDMFQQK